MRTSVVRRILTLGLLATAMARPSDSDDGGDDNGGHNGDDGSSSIGATATATSASVAPTASGNTTSFSSNSTALIRMKGGTTCTDLLCVGGLVNGSSITYTLQSLGKASLGWMAMGFGSQMANTPMVIMWPNTDGSITLSQRKAPAEVMPTVDSSPPRVASAEPSLSQLTGSNPKLVFTIPTDSSTSNSIIWAFSSTNPGDSAKDATLVQHLDSGPVALDLTQTLSTDSMDPTNPVFTIAQSSTGAGSSNSTSTTPGSFGGLPLLPYQKYIVAHGIMLVIGFLFLLPLGAILARYLRTFTGPIWFKLHWIIQFVLALPIIVTGFALGVVAVNKNGVPHQNDTHKRWGVAIFVIYLLQVFLGAFIHFLKVPLLQIRGRSFQNYFHAILGIFIIGASFYQVRTGFRKEWPQATGRGPIANGANITWIVWLVLIPTIYFAGMLLLPRQYKQEEDYRRVALKSGEPSIEMMQNQRPSGTY